MKLHYLVALLATMAFNTYSKTEEHKASDSSSLSASSPYYPNCMFIYPRSSTIPVLPTPLFIGIVRNEKNRLLKNVAITLLIDGKPVGIVKSNKDGVWSYRIKAYQALSQGSHIATAITTKDSIFIKDTTFIVGASTAKSGNVDASQSFIVYPYESAMINTSTPTIVGFVNDSNGSPVENETVVGSIDATNPLYTVLSDSNGVWSYTLSSEEALSDGDHITAARARDTGITLSPQLFTIDTVAPLAPVITAPNANATLTGDNSVTIVGTTEAYATVTVFINGDTTGQTTSADAFGVWSLGLFLANGTYAVTAQAQDLAGNVGPLTDPLTFTIAVS